jgi:hypothetical protein
MLGNLSSGRRSGVTAAVIALFVGAFLCASSLPTAAQDVLIVPKSKDENKNEKPKSDNSWLNFVTPKPEKDSKPRNENKPNAREKQVQNTSPVLMPNAKGNDKVVEPELPIELREAATVAAGELNGILLKMKESPTQVIQQAEYTPDKNRKFNNEISLEISKLKFSNEDLVKTAEGTNVKPDELLQICEPRITGVAIGAENAGVDFELRGVDGKGTAGYEKTLSSIHVVLSMACKLAAPPRNRGTIPRMGEYYLLGVAQGGCTPDKPINNGRVNVAFVYEGGGTVSCVVK